MGEGKEEEKGEKKEEKEKEMEGNNNNMGLKVASGFFMQVLELSTCVNLR